MSIRLADFVDDRRFSGLKVAILTAGPACGAGGGAERLNVGLEYGFRSIGCSVEIIHISAQEDSVGQIIENYDAASAMDLSKFDFVVSGKVPTYAVRHPRHVLYLVHTVRVFDDMFDESFRPIDDSHYENRALVHQRDFEALKGAKSRLAIGEEVARRLYRWRGMTADVIHPPLGFNAFKRGNARDYFFIAGRLHSWKRFGLLIEAVRRSALPLKLMIAGDGEYAEVLRQEASGDPRIEFMGRLDDNELVSAYSGAIAVPFIPVREDYGYVTLEAFASGKPILTCTDSGEPAQIVRAFETGLIAEPNSESICQALEWFWLNREQAAKQGENGYKLIDAMSWSATAATLAKAAMEDECRNADNNPVKVAVLDMQPIDPPIGGGRVRLLGLYHNLGSKTACKYVGTYDWPGEKYRSHYLSPTLLEIDVPLSDLHHSAAAELAAKADGKNLIDLAFSSQVHLSPEFVKSARDAAVEADVVIFSHPWVFPLVKDCLRPSQVVVYDSQNVEGFLRAQLLNERNDIEAEILRNVVHDEFELGKRADWILTCSHEDLLRFRRLYGFSPQKMRVAPNGVMAFKDTLPDMQSKAAARKKLGLSDDAQVGLFIGSGYGPNVDAARFIACELAPAAASVTFVIAGGVGATVQTDYSNVIITGQLNETEKNNWFHAADFAINPMMSGSGTNIKMFDFMALGLPVITTAIGARGIESGAEETMLIVDPTPAAFIGSIAQLNNLERRNSIAQAARRCVEDGYAWERISAQLGLFLRMRQAIGGQSLPKFSVVCPSFDRPQHLQALMQALQKQVERDFEVIIVDQSDEPWSKRGEDYGFPISYFHTPVKGAVRARNTGAMLAQGEIIAFIDDDCLPEPRWLLNARPHFDDPDVVGVEGKIFSDRYDDPDWRPVSNVGFEGIGFMTANLMVRSSAFQFLGGFDLTFDHPHFREDTDFGWRMQNIGKVPYANDVPVFHPAQPRIVERESLTERVKFFQKDALLYRKHPDRYRELFLKEGHWLHTKGFRENLLLGFKSIDWGISDLPEWMVEKLDGNLE